MLNPYCVECGEKLLRWAWYEDPDEPVEYWYCLACDIRTVPPAASYKPFVKILPTRPRTMAERMGRIIDNALRYKGKDDAELLHEVQEIVFYELYGGSET